MLNEEQFEAVQEDANAKRESFQDTLPPEQQEKFKIVEEVVKKLVDNNILFYLFPYLPCPLNENIDVCWQWNNLKQFMEHLPSGADVTEESRNLAQGFNASLLYCIYNMFNSFNPEISKLNPEEKWKNFAKTLYSSIQHTNKRLKSNE